MGSFLALQPAPLFLKVLTFRSWKLLRNRVRRDGGVPRVKMHNHGDMLGERDTVAGPACLAKLCYDNCSVCTGRSQAGWREESKGPRETTLNVY